MWNDYENDTLIHQHKMAKIYKKRYQRASDLNNTLIEGTKDIACCGFTWARISSAAYP